MNKVKRPFLLRICCCKIPQRALKLYAHSTLDCDYVELQPSNCNNSVKLTYLFRNLKIVKSTKTQKKQITIIEYKNCTVYYN